MKRRHFFLIQLLLWIAILLVSNHSWAASPATMTQDQQTKAVQSLEDTLFATNYSQEPLAKRLDRLETITFGQTRSDKPVEYRIRYLQDTIAQNTFKPLDEKPSQQSANANYNYAPSLTPPPQQQGAYQPPPAADATDYPTVTAMERKVFNRAYAGESLENRLTRLEMQVFKIKQNGALSDRMDNLKLLVLGDTGNPSTTAPDPYANDPYANTQPQAYPPQTAYQQPYQQVQQGYQQVPTGYPSAPYGQQANPYGQYAQPYNGGGAVSPDMLTAMNDVEKNVIGQTFPTEPFESRMNRVETKVFGQTSPEMSNEDRMQRVIAVAAAGGAPQSPQAKAKSTMMNLLPIILTILPMILL